ncbi:putative Pentatricopeptide repeat-containing protein [Tripterygium wilfordii]|uniref:Putative Pentatricopeptide repeat-containing protein n=1 Tax=Tripterygium wilfordii TaxID=458696 RepID=A0A7J7D4R8_TRIWF|nr:pentatricopeptide repeat-containing protein At5g48730, chloroplastic [Tripterygium wilfordii]KAF5741268.1 putative Pentatricopeptide repeat-containing protein [Tripterygium wilfordii]
MALLSGPNHPLPPAINRSLPTNSKPARTTYLHVSKQEPPLSLSGHDIDAAEIEEKWMEDLQKQQKKEDRERKEAVNRKIASRKAISIILRREATKVIIEKKRGPNNSKKLLPRTVLEALHERITALRWESALKVFELLREQLWYEPNSGVYIKLFVMLGKCKQPEKARELFHLMIDEGCDVSQESYTALLSAYSRSGLFDEAFMLLEEMKNTPDCMPDVHTYSILIKSCLQVFAFDKVQALLSDMASNRIRPNTVTYNTLIDAYGKAKLFLQMESTLVKMLSERGCEPDVWTMNSTLRAFGNSGQIEMMERCYDKFQGAGIQPNIKTFNILLDSYGKVGNYEKMGSVMEFMQKYHYSWTIVTYNVVIDAFGRAGDLKQMEYLFRLMCSERIKPSCVTLCSLVRAYGQAGKLAKIGGVLRFIENSDVTLDTVFFNCLVDAYGTMGCLAEMKGVLKMMEQKGCKPDKITYRTMIKAYSRSHMTSHVKELKDLVASAQKPRLEKKKPDF